MLSTRSKLLVTLAVLVLFTSLFDLIRERTSWFVEPVTDWWVPWLITGILVALALLSIAFDRRRNG